MASRGPRVPAGTTSLASDLACLDAGGAHVHVLGGTTDGHAAALDVRVPAAAGTAVRERDVVAEDRPLAAYVADGSHSSLHLTRFRKGPCPPLGAGQAAVEAYPMPCSRANRPVGTQCPCRFICCQV